MKGANPKTPEVLALWDRGDLTTKQVAEAAGVTYSVPYSIPYLVSYSVLK